MLDIQIDATNVISNVLENRIKQLEVKLEEMENQKVIDDLLKMIWRRK